MFFGTSESVTKHRQKLFPIFFIICLLASCSHHFNKTDNSTENKKSEIKYTTINGTLNMPEAFQNSPRTAFPSLPALTATTCIIKAVGTDTVNPAADVEATIVSENAGTATFVLNIPTPETTKKYKIKASIIYNSKEILKGESEEFSINPENAVTSTSQNIVVSANQTTGKTGNIDLEIGIESDSGITKCRIAIDDTQNAATPTVSSNKISFSYNNLSIGIHSVIFNFTDNNDNLLYSFSESINIFDNLTTNTWIQNGSDPWFTTTTDVNGKRTTTCRITKAMVDNFKLTHIYVDSSAATSTETGSFLNPCKTFDTALAKLNDVNKDYTILIKGTLTGNQSIPATLKKSGSGSSYTFAHSLTICGATGLNGSGEPQDSLNGSGTTSVLSIETEVPVTIKNLKITGGNKASGSGGGIYISNTYANVYLADGAVITGNEAKTGGGVYVDTGDLFVYGSAVIGKSGVSSHATSGYYGNKATTSGGGIGVGSGTLWLGYSAVNIPAETSGGVIYNLVMGASETHGGGIDNQKGTVNIARGNVSYNYACCNSGSTATGCGGGISTARIVNLTGTAVIEKNYSSYGGGVYITKDSYNGSFTMTGGTIRLNHADKEHPGTGDSWGDGGGVAIGSNGSFTISGGTISTNYAERCGGAVVDHFGTAFNIKDSAYIPYDSVNSCNDVYIESNKRITISKPLSPPDACTDGIIATITPSAYTEGTVILTISAPATAADVSHFAVMPNDSDYYSLNSEGKLQKYLALPSSSSDMVSGKTYAVADSSAMQKLSEFSSAGYNFSGVTLKLNSNVTIDTAWTPIGNITAFSGTFDGNEKKVTFDPESNAEAFFGTVKGTVKNLTVEGSTSVAGIAKIADTSAVIENCESSATVTGSTSEEYCAGIVAVVENATIKGCVNTGTITSNFVLSATNVTYGAGGITGRVKSGGIVDSCVNTGSVTGPNAGGISASVSSNSTIRNAYNSGNVTSTELFAGGITGAAVGSGAGVANAAHIDNCFNSGDVTAEGTQNVVYVGGIVGKLGWGNGSWAQNCLNIGNVSISAGAKAGSMAGTLFGLKDSYSQIDFCYYKEGCAGSRFGTGGSTSDTANECIKATQSGTNNAVTSAGVTLNETSYSAGSSTVLSLLNAWVSANSTGGLYLVWESDTNHWPKLKTE